jgi:hypothetical protein
MKARILFCIFLITCHSSEAQNNSLTVTPVCRCQSELEFVVDYVETNAPSYQEQVGASPRRYSKMKAELFSKAKGLGDNRIECLKLLIIYVEYFNDNHMAIADQGGTNIDESNETTVTEFLASDIFRSKEILPIPKGSEAQLPNDKMTGIFETADSAYTVLVTRNKTEFRDYVGIVLKSRSKIWKPGQVKFEIRQRGSNDFDAFVYLRNHTLRYFPRFNNIDGILGETWFKDNRKTRVNYSSAASSKLVFSTLNDSTFYLRIPSFQNNLFAKIDSLYQKAFPIIKTKAFLIVDVRNNGGGSDRNIMPLLDLINTHPMIQPMTETYVTKENIKKFERWYNKYVTDSINHSKNDLAETLNKIDKLNTSPLYSFVKNSKFPDTLTFSSRAPSPRKIAILFNRGCASSCETLLFLAKQSSKTILVGENSGGYMAYGEVSGIKTPCFNFSLNCTMTRTKDYLKYERFGIEPDHRLIYDRDWVVQTIDLLQKY